MTKKITLLFFLTISIVLVAGDKQKLDPVQKRYKSKLEYAKKQYHKTLKGIRSQMLKDYQKLQNKAMTKGDLKAANEYQTKIKTLKEGGSLVPVQSTALTTEGLDLGVPTAPGDSKLSSKLVGTKWSIFKNSTFEFISKDKAVLTNTNGPHDCTWKVVDEKDRKIQFLWAGVKGPAEIEFDKKFKNYKSTTTSSLPINGKKLKK